MDIYKPDEAATATQSLSVELSSPDLTGDDLLKGKAVAALVNFLQHVEAAARELYTQPFSQPVRAVCMRYLQRVAKDIFLEVPNQLRPEIEAAVMLAVFKEDFEKETTTVIAEEANAAATPSNDTAV